MNIGKVLRISIVVVIAAISTSAWTGEPAEKSRLVTANFQNTDVVVIAESVSKFTGIAIAVDPKVKRSANLISDKALTAPELHQLFVRAMTERGLEVVEEGGKVTVRNKAPAASRPGSDGLGTTK